MGGVDAARQKRGIDDGERVKGNKRKRALSH